MHDDKCFQYTTTLLVNHKEIGENSLRTPNIKPCLNEHNWEGIGFPSGKHNCKNLKKNPTIDLNLDNFLC